MWESLIIVSVILVFFITRNEKKKREEQERREQEILVRELERLNREFWFELDGLETERELNKVFEKLGFYYEVEGEVKKVQTPSN